MPRASLCVAQILDYCYTDEKWVDGENEIILISKLK